MKLSQVVLSVKRNLNILNYIMFVFQTVDLLDLILLRESLKMIECNVGNMSTIHRDFVNYNFGPLANYVFESNHILF